MARIASFFFRQRNFLAGIPLLFALVSTRWEWEEDWAIWFLATLMCGAGVALRTWAVSHCNYASRDRKQLATTGPYAFVRNPLYVGNLCILTGATLASELEWFLPIAIGWALLVYAVAIRHEERRLLENYGEAFLRYRERVPAWIPRIPLREHPLARRLLRESATFLLLLPFVLKELNVFGLGS